MSEIQDEAYTELCIENERLRALLRRAAEALEAEQNSVGPSDYAYLIRELRKAAG